MPDSPASTPLVSAVVPTYDRVQLLHRAVEAILSQDYAGEIECIVVFDGPGEALPDVPIRKNRSLRGVRNQRTPGLAGARNSGIVAARGELVAFCDDDDEWLPTKLSQQVEDLMGSPGHLVVTSGIITVSDGGKERELSLAQREITHTMFLRSRVRSAHSSTLLVRRSALIGPVGLLNETLPGSYAEDHDWLLRASRHAPVLVTSSPQVRIRVRRTSHFKQQWETMSAAMLHLLDAHPDLRTEKQGLARIYGRLSIAEAALGHRRVACAYAVKSLRLHWRQHRAYTGLAIAAGLISADRAVWIFGLAGKGI